MPAVKAVVSIVITLIGLISIGASGTVILQAFHVLCAARCAVHHLPWFLGWAAVGIVGAVLVFVGSLRPVRRQHRGKPKPLGVIREF